MQSYTSKIKKTLSAFILFTLLTQTVGAASAATILFQDDTFGDIQSDTLRIGSNDAGASNNAIQFGANSTASENGNILWNITTDAFEIDHTVNITGGLTTTGVSTIGDGSATVSVNSSDWDVSATGNLSGIGTIGADGLITGTAGATLSGAALNFNASSNFATNINTGTSTGAVSIGNSANTVTLSGGTNTVTGTTNINTSGSAATNVGTGTGNVTVGNATGTASITSSAWSINSSGAASGLTGLSSSGTVSFTGGASVSGGTANLNASSNNATNINTGTSTGAVSIGGGSGTVSVNSTSWDISTAGAISGVTTIGASGIITGSDFQIGTTSLTETTSAADSGAFLVGAFDEFDNSNATNVQDILDDFDALIGANLPNVETLRFEPEYPDAVIYADTSNNAGTLVSDRDNANNRNYYGWTSNNGSTQDMDVRTRIVLPDDFVSIGNFTFEYITGTTTTADNRIDVTLINVTDSNTTCATSTNNASTTWATGTITSGSITAGCTAGTALGAGDVLEVVMKLHDNSGAGDFSRVGFINQAYTN